MAAKKSESVNIRKYKGKRELNIGIFLFVIVLFYLIVTLVLYLSEDTPSVYEVREGSIVKDTSYTGLIIRDEQDIKSEGSGYIYYYFNDNSKIKAGANVYALVPSRLETGSSDSAKASTSVNSEVQTSITHRIENFNDSFTEMDFSTVYSLKDEINTYLQSNVSETKMQQLDTVIAASGQSVSSYPSSADGIMTFSTDGMEELTKDTFTAEDFDRLSHIGVLTLVSLSTPFLLSHFLDNIVRNQLMVIEENGEAVNLYAYMQEKWGLNASGTPKSYEMIPKEKNCLNKKQLGAVLLSETIYEEGEDFGEFTDAEILKLTNSETGMGQYSRAFVVAHTNVLLDFEKDLRGTIQARMYNAAFTCFYVELLMFEETALTCFNKELIDLMAEVMRIEPTEFLTRARTITNRYLNTVDFWNVSVNYPSSQKSLQMIRKSFLIDDLKEKMEYNQKQVGNIFDINREIVDRQEAKEEKERDDQSNTALTILSVLCFFSAMIDGNDYLSTLDWLIPAGVLDIILKGVFPITMIGILLYVLKKLYGRSK